MNKFISLSDITPKGVECVFEVKEIDVDDKNTISVCVLMVNGKYEEGSLGAGVGEYLRGLTVFLREIYCLDALVLNLSDLSYRWGNNLLRAVLPETLQVSDYYKDSWLGYRIVASKNNIESLKSLFCDFGATSGIVDIYQSVDKAIKSITGEVK